MKIITFLVAVVLTLSGCSSKPSTSIDKIKEKAISGDIQGVYSYFDKPKITDDLIKQAIKQLESENNNILREMNIQKIKNEAEDIIKLRVWDVIDDEVRKGKEGSIANIKTIKEEISNKYNATILVQLDNGKQTTFQLSMINNKWLITGLVLKDTVKNKIFKRINANPSFNQEKIKLIEEYVNKYQDDKFHALIKTELQKLVGTEYDTLINNMSAAGPIKKDGQYIIVDGNAPHSGGFDEGIVVIDVSSGILSAAIMKNGNKIDRYSDIKGEDDYPDPIRFWNKP